MPHLKAPLQKFLPLRKLSCYEARVVLDEAMKGLKDVELQAKILIRRTIIETWLGQYHEAWDTLKEAQVFYERCGDAVKGRWHGQLALVLRRLATAEGRADYADRSIIEFTAAIYHCEQAKHERYCATSLNNLAMQCCPSNVTDLRLKLSALINSGIYC